MLRKNWNYYKFQLLGQILRISSFYAFPSFLVEKGITITITYGLNLESKGNFFYAELISAFTFLST